MSSFFKARRVMAIATIAAALLCGCALMAAPASAAPTAPQVPRAATGCNGEVCMHVTSPGGYPLTTITIDAWTYAKGYKFYGHYELTVYDIELGYVIATHNSNTATWTHTKNYYWRHLPALIAKYCVTGWKYYHRHYYKIGKPCETVES